MKTTKRYIFIVELSGWGETLEEAWQDCCDAVQSDGLSSNPPEEREPEQTTGLDPTRSTLDDAQCRECGEYLPRATETHCE